LITATAKPGPLFLFFLFRSNKKCGYFDKKETQISGTFF